MPRWRRSTGSARGARSGRACGVFARAPGRDARPNESFSILVWTRPVSATEADYTGSANSARFAPSDFRNSGGRQVARKTMTITATDDVCHERTERLVAVLAKPGYGFADTAAVEVANSDDRACAERPVRRDP